MKPIISIVLFSLSSFLTAQTPEVTSWKINTTNATGFAGILSNVQQVQYSNTQVYISATCIPDYTIGPWKSNPNTPVNKNFVFKITRKPTKNTAISVQTPLGHIGVWSNGVSIFNAKDGMSYNNANVWHQDALFHEGVSFDNCLGHPAPGGEYHLHVNPTCLYNDKDSTNHSPIIGYAFDGFPIYGAYGYTNTNGTGAIKRMKSSYVKNTATTRVNGPAVDATNPIGSYIEDYKYVSGSGDLDDHNGRFCTTPDYPTGTYAYFVTIDATLYPVYPYTVGPTYYGTVQSGNTGMNSGHNTITESVTTYLPSTSSVLGLENDIQFSCYPNPSSGNFILYMSPSEKNNFDAEISNELGQVVFKQSNIQPTIPYSINLTHQSAGIYFIKITGNGGFAEQKILLDVSR